MNATRMSTFKLFAAGLVMAIWCTTADGQTKLNRSAVDDLLKQARQAIESGDLTSADQIITRCEAAKVRYPLLHFGDTPSSLRRELTRARNQHQTETGIDPSDPFSLASNNLPDLPDVPATTNTSDTPGYPSTTPTGAPQPLAMAGTPQVLPGVNSPGAMSPREQALDYMRQSRTALATGDLNRAANLAARASSLNVPESEFGPSDDRPSQLAWEIQQRRLGLVTPAVANAVADQPQTAAPAVANGTTPQPVQPAAATLPFNVIPELAQLPGSRNTLPNLPATPLDSPSATQLIEQGEAALRAGDRTTAFGLFQQANGRRGELPPTMTARLDDHLKMFASTGASEAVPAPQAGGSNLLDAADEQQQVLAKQLSNDVGRAQVESRDMLTTNPKQALDLLVRTRAEVENSSLIDQYKRQLMSRLDQSIQGAEQYIDANRAQLELDERNRQVRADIDRDKAMKIEFQTKVAELIDQYNQLHNEQRYAEADLIAKRLYELDPDNQVVKQLWLFNKFVSRTRKNEELDNEREGAFWQADYEMRVAATPGGFYGRESEFPEDWEGLIRDRRSSSDITESRSARELEIMQNLKKPVMIRYEQQPLSAVMDDLSKMTGVNIVLDPRGLTQEGVSSDTRVSFAVNREISLRSALNLILEPLHLSYVVKDEVLKVTSEQLRDGQLKARTYNVADLVIPIPNFVPSNNIGLQGLINDAYSATGYSPGGIGGPGPLVLANSRGGADAATPEGVLAQPGLGGVGQGPTIGGFGGGPSSIPIGGGPGGLGAGANADFDSLIDLIISTVAADTWAENGGGEAEIRPFPTNLSIVVSQTEAVHEEIADLLKQLRKLQDLQVTIEVRFIRLNDSFFERIGIDFDVNIEDRSVGTEELTTGESPEPPFSSTTIGIQPPTGLNDFPNYTADLDIPFRQESFNLAVPQFGTPVDVATFGFAILSDIEAYFLINASQGDRRSNVLNAPKVTLFNGQQAFVADTSQTPFVISVIPVVGEFAAAQQPVIVVLSEGTLMTIQAVVSDDRRYVRLTVVPFFSEIGDVQEFTFEGTTSTSTSSSTTDDNGDGNNNSEDGAEEIVRSGTTVQLPPCQFVSVTTTVSVPDGGTVLLGGIKRLSEGRNEFGVPLLSKVPYINRLFKNVGIGRETDSLMMMVTPRIIIQEEEEAKLLGTAP